MLHELRIENIAVIETADIIFEPGLNVMTGETGAGKSIILDAISAVTGGRVSRDLIRTGADFATVTAVFDSDEAEDWLKENGLDAEDEDIILHRRISADGKSSARVCGVPVTVGQLRMLGACLLELHGQNDGLRLLDEREHLSALDRFAAISLSEYQQQYGELNELKNEQNRLNMAEADKMYLQERLTETCQELEAANLQAGEYGVLTERRELLRHSEKLTEALGAALNALNADDGAISRQQDAAWNCQKASEFATELNSAAEKLEQAGFLLTDAEELIRDFQEGLDFSPEEYDRIESRLHTLNRLERKYRRDLDELPDYLEECKARLNEIAFSEERLKKLEKEIQRKEEQCWETAKIIHSVRVKAAEVFSSVVESELHDLSMSSARFYVEVNEKNQLMESGMDDVRFLLAANRGEEPGRLSRIASGGELSRVMLALKNVLSRDDPIATMVFDEIDTGVSGIAAQRVGEKLAELSRSKQVLCVTHLPQLASMADAHFLIIKTEKNGRTYTDVSLLNRDGRCRELARLHGGDNITETTLRSAEEQLQYAEKYKNRSKTWESMRN